METPSYPLDSVTFADLQVRYMPRFWDHSLTLTLGINNLFDKDPPRLDTGRGMSLVLHDLPGGWVICA